LSKPLVGILMGSDSDFSVMEEASKVLENFSINHEVIVSSAHRSPERTRKYVVGASKRGIKILIGIKMKPLYLQRFKKIFSDGSLNLDNILA